MLKYIQIGIENESRWNNLLYDSINSSYRAGLRWQYRNQHFNKDTATFIFSKNGEDLAGAHYTLSKQYNGYVIFADIKSGIIFHKEPEEQIVISILKHFASWAKMNRASFISFTPWLPKTIDGDLTQYNSLFNKVIKSIRFHPVCQGRHTYWIDLSLSEDELISNMRKSQRKIVRKGVRSSLSVEVIEDPDEMIMEEFWMLYSGLSERKDFKIVGKKDFFSMIEALTKGNQGCLFITKYEDKTLNITLASNFGQAASLYSAINPVFKRIDECPSPGVVSRWEIIKSMKEKGLKIYDMGFCPGKLPQEGHPHFNIWNFKYSFGGKHVQFLPTYGRILKPIRGKLFEMIRYRHKHSE